MNPNEILPSPEKAPKYESHEGTEIISEQGASQAVEQKPVMSSGFGAVSAVTTNDAQQQVQGITATQAQGGAQMQSVQFDVPEVAEDIDLIEKTWVKKAKDIVLATQGDPHKQNKQINRMKVEYIKKRYNKDVKFKEES